MRKTLTLLAALILMLSFVACSSSVTPQSEGTEKTEGTVSNNGTKKEEIAFSGTTLVDNENCTIKVTSIDPDSMWGYTLNFYLENKTDQNLMFSIDSSSINGLMNDPFFASEVAAGKKANKEVSWDISALEDAGMNVTDITFDFLVYDSNDFMADNLVEEEFSIFPYGESAVQQFSYEEGPNDLVIFDNEYASMIATDFDENGLFGYTMTVYLENKTDKDVMFGLDNCSVNGFMADPFWSKEVNSGKKAVSDITWSESSFEENGIVNVDEIEFSISVYDSNDFMADNLVEGTYTITH